MRRRRAHEERGSQRQHRRRAARERLPAGGDRPRSRWGVPTRRAGETSGRLHGAQRASRRPRARAGAGAVLNGSRWRPCHRPRRRGSRRSVTGFRRGEGVLLHVVSMSLLSRPFGPGSGWGATHGPEGRRQMSLTRRRVRNETWVVGPCRGTRPLHPSPALRRPRGRARGPRAPPRPQRGHRGRRHGRRRRGGRRAGGRAPSRRRAHGPRDAERRRDRRDPPDRGGGARDAGGGAHVVQRQHPHPRRPRRRRARLPAQGRGGERGRARDPRGGARRVAARPARRPRRAGARDDAGRAVGR